MHPPTSLDRSHHLANLGVVLNNQLSFLLHIINLTRILPWTSGLFWPFLSMKELRWLLGIFGWITDYCTLLTPCTLQVYSCMPSNLASNLECSFCGCFQPSQVFPYQIIVVLVAMYKQKQNVFATSNLQFAPSWLHGLTGPTILRLFPGTHVEWTCPESPPCMPCTLQLIQNAPAGVFSTSLSSAKASHHCCDIASGSFQFPTCIQSQKCTFYHLHSGSYHTLYCTTLLAFDWTHKVQDSPVSWHSNWINFPWLYKQLSHWFIINKDHPSCHPTLQLIQSAAHEVFPASLSSPMLHNCCAVFVGCQQIPTSIQSQKVDLPPANSRLLSRP